MHIAMLAPCPEPEKATDGFGSHVYHLSKWLARQDSTSVTLISFGAEDRTRICEGFKVVTIRARKWYRYVPFIPLLKLRRVLMREKPDIIHVQGSAFNYYVAFALTVFPRGIPRLMTVHGHPVQEGLLNGWLKRNSLKRVLMEFGERRALLDFDLIVCVTSALMMEIRRDLGDSVSNKIRVIQNGIDVEEFEKETGIVLGGSSKRTFPGHPFTIVNTKALVKNNGQEYLIRALPKVVEMIPDARLVLVGEGQDRRHLEDLIGGLGLESRVHLAGRVTNREVIRHLLAADVFAVTSVRIGGVEEGSSIALIEAMASGMPIVASEIGGLKETITHLRNGMLVPERDSRAIAEAILFLYENPQKARELSSEAAKMVLSERTWGAIAGEYHTAYSMVLAESRRPRS